MEAQYFIKHHDSKHLKGEIFIFLFKYGATSHATPLATIVWSCFPVQSEIISISNWRGRTIEEEKTRLC